MQIPCQYLDINLITDIVQSRLNKSLFLIQANATLPLVPAYPVKFFEEDERSGFNQGPPLLIIEQENKLYMLRCPPIPCFNN